MLFYFDESGDFAFPDFGFDCYVQAAVICPDSLLPDVERFVHGRISDWGVEELHAKDLSSKQIHTIAEYIAESGLELLATVTDNSIVTLKSIASFRLAQAAQTEKNLQTYRRGSTKALGAPVKEIENWMLRQIKRAGLASQISHSEFVQAVLMMDLIGESLQKSLIRFQEARWRDDFEKFTFTLDAKLNAKLANGEKYLDESIVPMLGSRPHQGLVVVRDWGKPPIHPFLIRYGLKKGRVANQTVEGAFDLNLIFEQGLRFKDSSKHAGLQLADAVAYVIRKVVLLPADHVLRRSYELIRPQLQFENGRSLMIRKFGGSTDTEQSTARYRELI